VIVEESLAGRAAAFGASLLLLLLFCLDFFYPFQNLKIEIY
jgi:hypothetical protein